VYPQHQLGIVGSVRGSRREATELGSRPAVDVGMHRLHGGAGRVGFGLAAERDQVERAQRAPVPASEIEAIAGVLRDPDRNQRVGDLQQHRGAAAEEGGDG
jgi:hypothetical protein